MECTAAIFALVLNRTPPPDADDWLDEFDTTREKLVAVFEAPEPLELYGELPWRSWVPHLVGTLEGSCHPAGWVDLGNGVHGPPVLLEIRFCESTDNYLAANPRSSARGGWQITRGSWEWYGFADRFGVPEAHLATPAQQDEAAVEIWRRDGTRPWLASRHCHNS